MARCLGHGEPPSVHGLTPARYAAHAGDPLQGTLPKPRGLLAAGGGLFLAPAFGLAAQRSSTGGAAEC